MIDLVVEESNGLKAVVEFVEKSDNMRVKWLHE